MSHGGPAFPIKGYTADASGALCGEVVSEPGMTLRDYFAAKAMQARLNAGWAHPEATNKAYRAWQAAQPPDGDGDYDAFIAESAYELADEMLKARGK